MADTEVKTTECTSCKGKLVNYDDYVFHRAVKFGLAAAPTAAVICAVWAPLFFLIRLMAGGAIGQVGAGALVVLLIKKMFIGAVIGVMLGAVVGIGRDESGLLLGAIVGSLGGFFIAAAEAMPLLSDAAHRIDIVLVAVISGILCAATVYITNKRIKTKFADWTGPEPRDG